MLHYLCESQCIITTLYVFVTKPFANAFGIQSFALTVFITKYFADPSITIMASVHISLEHLRIVLLIV